MEDRKHRPKRITKAKRSAYITGEQERSSGRFSLLNDVNSVVNSNRVYILTRNGP